MVTGGAGFIGSNFIRYLLTKTPFQGKVVNVDKLTYAGNIRNLDDIKEKFENKRYFFEKEDICNQNNITAVLQKYEIDCIVHFAAESHVDRSIWGPQEFIQTNVFGTFSLLNAAKNYWAGKENVLFHHISTDEVYGSLPETGYFHETTPYDPRSPYSASKASSDHLVFSYYHTYQLPITLSNCSNNYGPYHFPEKLIPFMILNILEEKELPVYGDGKNIRDWLFIEDHCNAIYTILTKGKIGEKYNIGGENEWENIKLVHVLCEKLAQKRNKEKDYYKKLIRYVADRPGHDKRYAINCDKLKKELGWKPSVCFEEGLDITINWYLNHKEWIENIRNGAYQEWVVQNYNTR